MLIATFALILATSVWVSFTFGRVTADRRRNMNHHKMMMLLTDIRGQDELLLFLSSNSRNRLNRLLVDYESLDFDD